MWYDYLETVKHSLLSIKAVTSKPPALQATLKSVEDILRQRSTD